jgi:hypothetical protein
MALKGRAFWPVGEDLRPERALLAAVALQAVRDARAGCAVAGGWCDDVLSDVLEALGLRPHDWREATGMAGPRRRKRESAQQSMSGAERSRVYRQQKRERAGAGRHGV